LLRGRIVRPAPGFLFLCTLPDPLPPLLDALGASRLLSCFAWVRCLCGSRADEIEVIGLLSPCALTPCVRALQGLKKKRPRPPQGMTPPPRPAPPPSSPRSCPLVSFLRPPPACPARVGPLLPHTLGPSALAPALAPAPAPADAPDQVHVPVPVALSTVDLARAVAGLNKLLAAKAMVLEQMRTLWTPAAVRVACRRAGESACFRPPPPPGCCCACFPVK
jgi:hypothetical protein